MKWRKLTRLWGKPWDYTYLLQLEQAKLKEMAAYFEKSQIVSDWMFQVRDCKLCVKLIDIILEKDKPFIQWLKSNYSDATSERIYDISVYVNLKNIHRFFPKAEISEHVSFATYMCKVDLRQQKAFNLYHKIRLYRMQGWWD